MRWFFQDVQGGNIKHCPQFSFSVNWVSFYLVIVWDLLSSNGKKKSCHQFSNEQITEDIRKKPCFSTKQFINWTFFITCILIFLQLIKWNKEVKKGVCMRDALITMIQEIRFDRRGLMLTSVSFSIHGVEKWFKQINSVFRHHKIS